METSNLHHVVFEGAKLGDWLALGVQADGEYRASRAAEPHYETRLREGVVQVSAYAVFE